MSAVAVKVILMGFNLLVGARGNILMRKGHYSASNSVIAPTDAILLPPAQWYWSPLLSFAALLVLSGVFWWSGRSSILNTHAHGAPISIFQIHFTHHPGNIGRYSLFIAYLRVEGHQKHPAKGMNINPSMQQCGRARTGAMEGWCAFVRVLPVFVCACDDLEFAWFQVWF